MKQQISEINDNKRKHKLFDEGVDSKNNMESTEFVIKAEGDAEENVKKKKKQKKQSINKKDKETVEETKKAKKHPSELTEKELQLLERKQKKRLAQLAKKKLKKQQNDVNNRNNSVPVISDDNDANAPEKKKMKKKQKIEKQRRKPIEETQIINGCEVAIKYMDGFPIRKDDYVRLKQLKKDLKAKNIPKNEIVKTMKQERRKAEKSLTRERKNVCFNCRKSGHNLSECPEINNEQSGIAIICFKCGSMEHTHFQCKALQNDQYRNANCFICGEEGHLARECKNNNNNNNNGVYPKGGNCKKCGSNEHSVNDCPQSKQEQQQTSISNDCLVSTLNDHHENPEIHNGDNHDQMIKKTKNVKHVFFD